MCSENEYIRTIECSLTGHALRVSSTVDETKYLDKANGWREYIEDLERLFITGQDARSARLEFNGAKQKRGETILEYFGNYYTWLNRQSIQTSKGILQ